MAKAAKKTLLIEDDPDQSYLYSTKFQLEGLDIISAKSGSEGLSKAIAEKPDLILLDVVMNDMDGMEVLGKLRKNRDTKNIPVVLLTNLAKKELRERSKKLGVIGFWPKAEILPQEIADRVKNILGIK